MNLPEPPDVIRPSWSIAYMAISPAGGSSPWPSSRWRRVWRHLRGWTFIRRSEDGRPATLREVFRTPRYEIPLVYMERAEFKRLYIAADEEEAQ